MPQTVATSSRRVRAIAPHPALLLTVLATAMALGCSAAPPAAPAGTPGASPSTASPMGTPPASPPTATPTSAPASVSPSPAAGVIDHPTGATDVVLRMDQGGGMLHVGWLAAQAPPFTLYGDGSFLLRPTTHAERPDPWIDGLPRFLYGRMSDEYMQSLLRHALTTGRLLEARDSYPQNECADCGSTIFTLNAAGLSKVVTVDALEMAGSSGPDAGDRRGFAQLVRTIVDLEERARQGELGEVVLYGPDYYRLTLLEAFGEPVDGAQAWPWADVTADDFEAAEEFGLPTLVMPREGVELLVDVPSGGHNGVWVEEADGTQWQIAVRPLLPEEMPAD